MGVLMAIVAVVAALPILAGGSGPAWAGPDPADRMQLHRNVNRGVPYLKLSQAGQASSGAAIAMRAVRQVELDGDPLLNVRGNVYPIELNGGYGFVHFNGFRYMRVYDAGGRKLWQIDIPAGRVHRDALHRDTLAVLDADGDGDQDLAHCWVEGGRKVLLVRRGETGAVLRRAVLDGSPSDECQIAAFRVAGRSTPLILVSARNKSGCADDGNYIDTWGRTLAFDVNLNLVWDRNTCAAGHYVYPVDENTDGVAEKIFIGKHLYEPNGTRVCTADIGNTHADGVAVADLDPGRAGLEAVLTGANGVKAVSVAQRCAVIWTVPTTTIRNPQQMALAKLDPYSATPTVVIREKGTTSNATLFFLTGLGRILASYPNSEQKTGMPFQNANLDGKTGSDELMIQFARVIDQAGTIRLDTGWYWNLKGTKVRQVTPPTSWDSWPAFPFAMDLDHDGRDEIVTWSQSLIVVGKADGTTTPPAPVAVADSATTTAGTAVTVTVLANDTGTALTLASVTTPADGTARINTDRTVTYTPRAGFSGGDGFSYTIRDSSGRTASAAVAITVTVANPAPVANADSATTMAGTAVTINVLANDTGTSLTIASSAAPANGTRKVNGDDTITYTPEAGYTGGDSFQYTIRDGSGRTATATVSITVGGAAGPEYLGCYLDQATRDLNGSKLYDYTTMTVAICSDFCTTKGYDFFGVQAGYACFCGNDYGRYGPSNNCTSRCVGNGAPNCGGGWANSVYAAE